ncbi:hypothetical protein ACFQJC_06250 [Haloferax namakaokahaiae]|uniref:Polyketide cyclase / dehydrase and lipid transport n=1 Tax=Haloferax namakaokahaiae TaxID=1748331 RepID=A0ABD5ZCV7_9EURY
MPSPPTIDRPTEAQAVAQRYLTRERRVSALVVVVVVSLFLGTYLTTSLLPSLVVAATLLIVARAPLIQSHGTVRLRTDLDSETVVDSFTGTTPPVLAFQWGIADEIEHGDGTVTYRVSYLFGLRSVEVAVRTETETTPDGERIELDITVDGRPWATYTVTVHDDGDETRIDVEYTSNRRFGLRRLPQQFVADRYRDDALTAQGYTVVERDSHFGL